MNYSEKDRLKWVLKRRCQYLPSQLQTMTLEKLRKAVGDISDTEQQEFQQFLSRITPYQQVSIDALKEYCRQQGLATSGTKIELLEKFLEHNKPVPVMYNDPHQQQVIEREQYPIVISAGPGSGKTSTLARKIAKLAAANAKVIAVMYNVEAERSMKSKLRKLRVKYKDEPNVAIYVATFDKLAATRVPYSGNYSESIQKAAKLDWSHYADCYLFIDEAQDLADERLAFAQTLMRYCSKVVIAGDPRQEIYAGATYFSGLWESCPECYKITLYNNYRSGRQIIALCNYFSKNFFGNLHHDQQTNTTENGVIRAVQVATADIANAIYEEIKDTPSDGCLIISPVSVERYQHDLILEQVNIALLRSGKRTLKSLSVDQSLDFDLFNAGTSLKLKGLEADKVVIFGAGYDFVRYGSVEDRRLLRLLFVAMSRAKKELVFIIDKVDNRFLGCISAVLTATPYVPKVSMPRPRIVKPMSVRDYVKSHDLNVPFEIRQDIDRIDIGETNDTNGTLIEIYIGVSCGLIPQWYQEILQATIKTEYNGITFGYYPASKTLIVKRGEAVTLPSWFKPDSTEREQLSKQLFVIKKLLELGIWIDEPNLAELNGKDLTGLVNSLRSRFTITGWGRTLQKQLLCDRSTRVYNTISGILDFETSNAVIELKYSSHSRDPKHFLQAFLYSEITGKPVYLVNVYLGEVSLVEYQPEIVPPPGLYQIDRLSEGIRFAKALNTFQRIKLPEPVNDKILVAYDTESTIYLTSPEARLLEIGFCAAYSSGKVIALYSELGPQVTVADDANFYGILAGADADRDHRYLKLQTERFIQDITARGNYINLRWGTDDLGLVLGTKVSDISVERLHTLWCQKNQRSRSSHCTLSDVFRELLPELTFHAHHAYEDAYATMLVFFALVDWDG